MGEVATWHQLPNLLDEQFAIHKDQIEPIFQEVVRHKLWSENSWNRSLWTPAANEKTVYLFLRKIATVIGDIVPRLPNNVFRGPDDSTISNPSIIFAHKYAESEIIKDSQDLAAHTKANWPYYRAVADLVVDPVQDSVEGAWQRETTYLKELFEKHVTRLFARGFTLCGHILRFWHMDRGGALISDAYDIATKSGAEKLILVLLGLLSIDTPADLGLDPTIEVHQSDEKIDSTELQAVLCLMNVNVETSQLVITCSRPDLPDMKFTINSVLYQSTQMVGRATIIFSCKEIGAQNRIMTVKRSFLHHARGDHEGKLLKIAAKAGVKHIPNYFHQEQLQFEGTVISLLDYTRKGLTLSDSLGNVLGEFYFDKDSVAPKIKCLAPDRILQQLWTLDEAYPIWKERHLPTLLQGFCDAIQGWYDLFQKAKILHRNISIKNLMLRVTPDGGKEMFLYGFDCAILIDDEESGANQVVCTGTPIFMASELLMRPQRNRARHDLESFFWCFFWLACNYPGQKLNVRKELDRWHWMDARTLSTHKWWWLTAPQTYFQDELDKLIDARFEIVLDDLIKVREVTIEIRAGLQIDRACSILKACFQGAQGKAINAERYQS